MAASRSSTGDLMQPPGLVAFGFDRLAITVRLVEVGCEGVDAGAGLLELGAGRVDGLGQCRDLGQLIDRALFEVGDLRLRALELGTEVVASLMRVSEGLLELRDAGVGLLELVEHTLAVMADAFPLRLLVGEPALQLGHASLRAVELCVRRVSLGGARLYGAPELEGAGGRGREVRIAFVQLRLAVRQ